MPKRTAEEADKTRARLLAAGRALFAKRGFEAVSLEEIAAAAEVTRGALHHHFGNKVGLFKRVAEAILIEQGERILSRANRSGDQWTGLLEGCDAFIEESQREEYRQVILLDAPAILGIGVWQELDDRYTTSTLRSALEELASTLSIDDVEAVAEALSGAMNQVSLWAGGDNRNHAVRRAKAAVRLLIGALRRDTATPEKNAPPAPR